MFLCKISRSMFFLRIFSPSLMSATSEEGRKPIKVIGLFCRAVNSAFFAKMAFLAAGSCILLAASK